LIGDSNVGKSSLLLRFCVRHKQDDHFSESYISTIGVDFVSSRQRFKNLNVKSRVSKLQIVRARQWDTAGQERFRTITTAYYRNSDGVIIVFDKTSRVSFEHVTEWLEEVRRHATNPKVLIIGNKSDKTDECEVSMETAHSFATEHGVMYIETSALNAQGVEEAFTLLVNQLVLHRKPSEGLAGVSLASKVQRSGTDRECCGRSLRSMVRNK
jgi:Ras-related protein Rab-1A